MNITQEKIRVGVIGIGNWGRYGHIPVLRLLPNFEIVALASRRKQYAQQMAQELGIPNTFTAASELITHPEIDLVVVLPPAPQHAGLVREAIAAGKDVYCEWPLTTNIADSEDLLSRAEAAGVRHVVGLQRRMGPSTRYVRDLLAEGYIGQIRSVRMHVSMNYFQGLRSTDLAWTVPPENFSHILSIYGGHFMDMLFHAVGAPKELSALVMTQFPEITFIETGETFDNKTPDEVLVIGTLANGGAFTIQIEGGKRNNSGLQIDITGMEGDLKVSNSLSFANAEDNKVEGAQGDNQLLEVLRIPSRYRDLPASELDASVLDLAYLYVAYANDRENGSLTVPTFADAVKMHKLINLISEAASSGAKRAVRTYSESSAQRAKGA